MKIPFICLLIIIIGCTKQKPTNLNQDFLSKIGDSKTEYYPFYPEMGGTLFFNDTSKMKQIEILLTIPNEENKKELFDLDTFGRVTRHSYIEYQLLDNEEISIPVVEIFLYNSTSDTLLERIKYENDNQVEREMFIYKDGLKTHHYILDGENKLFQRAEYSYNEDKKTFLVEIVDKSGYIEIHEYEYDSNGKEMKSIHRGSKNKIVVSTNSEKRKYLAEFEPNSKSGYDPYYHYDLPRSRKNNRNKSIKGDKKAVVISDTTTIMLSNSTEEFIITKKNSKTIKETRVEEDRVEKTFDKFKNCIKSEVYEKGKLKKIYEMKIKYYKK
jgi:hypothetical protein